MGMYPAGTFVRLINLGIAEVNQYHRTLRTNGYAYPFPNLATEETEGMVIWEGSLGASYSYIVELPGFPKSDSASSTEWYFDEDMLRPAEPLVALPENPAYLQALNCYKQDHPEFDSTNQTPEDTAGLLAVEGYLQVEPWFLYGLAKLPNPITPRG